MKDRISQVPGRVKLTPVAGEANTFDLVRADQPTQEGTPLNKASLLKDSTAALFGLPNTAVPDDVLAKLWRFPSNLGNEYLWEKYLVENSIVKQAYFQIVIADSTDSEFYYGWGTYGKSLSINDKNKIIIEDTFIPTIAPNSSSMSYWAGQLPFYCTSGQGTYAGRVFYMTRISGSGSSGSQFFCQECFAHIDSQLKGYVNSDASDAYPPAVPDVYTYRTLGQLGEKTRIATGIYTGTGTYGVNNKNTLTFPFVPRLVMIGENNLLPTYKPAFTYFGQSETNSTGSPSSPEAVVEVKDTTFSWYSENAYSQHNGANTKYRYLAIG